VKIDLFVILVVVFMVLALWELRVDFAIEGLRIPYLTLSVCSALTLLATYYGSDHILAASICIMITMVAVILDASRAVGQGSRVVNAMNKKTPHDEATACREESTAVSNAAGAPRGYDNIAVSLFTVLYIPTLAACIILPLTFNDHPMAHAIMIVFLPAISDTGGLFFGAWLGKHKLSPRISPKKSVEGLLGSIILAIVGAYAIFAGTYTDWLHSYWWVPIVMGAVVGIVGTFGDLCASMLKRDIGIKDMGHLLKGHGGILDRVDSILLSAPFLAVLLWATGL
jgi:phosphatidate cytidylyltransferase